MHKSFHLLNDMILSVASLGSMLGHCSTSTVAIAPSLREFAGYAHSLDKNIPNIETILQNECFLCSHCHH